MLQLLLVTGSFLMAPMSDSVDDLLQLHQSTLQSLRTIHCNVEVTWDPLPGGRSVPARRGKFLMSGERVRVVDGEGANQVYHLVRDGKCYSFSQGRVQNGLTIKPANRSLGFIDIRPYAGLKLQYPLVLEDFPLPELVRLASSVTVNEQDDDLAVLHLTLPGRGANAKSPAWRTAITLNRRLGGMIANVIDEGAELGPGTRELALSNFVEFPGGLHFPTCIEGRLTKRGEVVSRLKIKLTDVRINEEMSESDFMLMLPHGVRAFDHLRGTTYIVDSHGVRISDEETYAVGAAVAAPASARSRADESHNVRPPTQEDSESFWFWVSGALGIALLILLIYWWRNRKP